MQGSLKMLMVHRLSVLDARLARASVRPAHRLQQRRKRSSKLRTVLGLLIESFQEALEMRREAHRQRYPMIEE
jgi:hypothetical protein